MYAKHIQTTHTNTCTQHTSNPHTPTQTHVHNIHISNHSDCGDFLSLYFDPDNAHLNTVESPYNKHIHGKILLETKWIKCLHYTLFRALHYLLFSPPELKASWQQQQNSPGTILFSCCPNFDTPQEKNGYLPCSGNNGKDSTASFHRLISWSKTSERHSQSMVTVILTRAYQQNRKC